MTQTQMPRDPNQHATTVKNLDNTKISVADWKGKKSRLKTLKTYPGNKNSGANNFILKNNTNSSNKDKYKNSNKAKKQPKTLPPCETSGEINHSNAYGTNQKRMRTTPWVILILEWVSLRAKWDKTLAWKMHTTRTINCTCGRQPYNFAALEII